MEAVRNSSSNIYLITPDQVDAIWDRVSVLLESAVALNDGYELDDVRAFLERGTQMLWVYGSEQAIHAAMVIEVLQYPRKKTVMALFAGGDRFAEWRDHFESLKAYARSIGAKDIELIGRRGWGRALNADSEQSFLRFNA